MGDQNLVLEEDNLNWSNSTDLVAYVEVLDIFL